jgi:hypothetical protein
LACIVLPSFLSWIWGATKTLWPFWKKLKHDCV